ncbi:hypothetical protein [Clostridium pasteurianum]|uniref:hypothetical protein n=1 Tax=Clostridium pasteurianum TaxID=1501 RepID=UPI00059FFDAF|nr:hypothetical protein [Clostridium pasteurianum]
MSFPSNSFSIKAINSTMCPFSNIEVGDSVTVNLIPYFNFSKLMRITHIVYTETNGIYDITFGNVAFKRQPPVKKLYKI